MLGLFYLPFAYIETTLNKMLELLPLEDCNCDGLIEEDPLPTNFDLTFRLDVDGTFWIGGVYEALGSLGGIITIFCIVAFFRGGSKFTNF